MKKHLISTILFFILFVFAFCGCIDADETPNIEFIKQDGWLRVKSVDKNNLTWNNINIIISSEKYFEIGFHSSPVISALKSYGNGSSCPKDWGEIQVDNGIMFTNVNSIVKLYWIPTNTLIGEWDFT